MKLEKKVCDHNGCGINPFRYAKNGTNNEKFYGAGADYTLDASKPLYVFSSFTRTEDAYKAASALVEAGFTDVRALDDSFEALQAQVPAAK